MTERRHFGAFDGLRAIAALSVVVTHASFTAGANGNHDLGGLFARMDIGVSIFFLISGFLLYRPFVAAHLGQRRALPLEVFFRNRALRILPAYWVALTVIVFVMGYGEIASWKDAAIYYGLVQIYDANRVAGGIGQAWSLCTEISFYAFLPLYAALLARLGRGRVQVELAGVAVLFATGLAVRWFVMDATGSVYDYRLTWLPATLDLFGLGMALAVLSAWADGRDRALTFLGRVPGLWWAAAAVTFWVVSYRVGLPRNIEPYSLGTAMERQVLYGLTALFLLVPAVFGPDRTGAVRRFLSSRVMTALGLISYGTYLWHKAFIEVVWEWLDQPLFRIDLGPLLAGTVAATIVAATASYYVVERPALRLKRARRRDEPADERVLVGAP